MSNGSRISVGPLLGAVGGVLLAVSLVLDWYDGVTGFTVFEALDLVLLALALAAVFEFAGELAGRTRIADAPRGRSLAIAGAAVVIVASQLINDPPAVAGQGGPDHATGIWLALGGSMLMLAGALAASARISFAMDLDAGRKDTEAPTEATRATPERGEGSRKSGNEGDDSPSPPATDPKAPTAVSDRPAKDP